MSFKLKLDFDFPEFKTKIQHGDKIVLLGSCFSNEIGESFKSNGFDVLSNPFGTIFHPVALARLISNCRQISTEDDVFQRGDLFFSWDTAGTIYGFSKEELRSTLGDIKNTLLQYIVESKYIFITFGSGFGYELSDTGSIVANCHKMPSTFFKKELTDLSEMIATWKDTLHILKQLNPALQVVFTVSPVRHEKDGLIENNRSKARLFELITVLQEDSSSHYFPAYEIVMDELRDYRFYKSDGLHPNPQTVDYVWERLKDKLMTQYTKQLCEKVMALRRQKSHRTLYENSREAVQFEKSVADKLSQFLLEYPEICW